MRIYIAEWNEKNDASRKWGPKPNGQAPLDDTFQAADVMANYLDSLGHEVFPATQRPPQSTKGANLDLFIGVGAGNPLQIWGSKKQADGNLLGIETTFPIVWVGAQNASSNPFGVRYRTLARWPDADIEDISPIQSPNKFIPFEDREKRDQGIKDSIDSILAWIQRCKNKPATILNLNKKNTEELDYLKTELSELRVNQNKMISSIDSIQIKLLNFNDLHSDLITKLENDIELNFEKLFDSEEEKEIILQQLAQIAKASNNEEWYNRPLKSKIKIMIPFMIFRYEKELDVTNFTFPQNWKELKGIFINEKKADNKNS